VQRSYDNAATQPNDEVPGFSMFRGQENSRWAYAHCWAVNSPVTKNIFIRPRPLVGSATFYPKMELVASRTYSVQDSNFSHWCLWRVRFCEVWHCVTGWVHPVVSQGHSDFCLMGKPSENAWTCRWKHQNP
jgi:hypothetical protein